MDAPTINLLASLDPAALISHPLIALNGDQGSGRSPLHHEALEQFLSKYLRVNFGWYIASQFATHRQPFPIALHRRDYWVFRAYLMLLNPWENFDENIATAFHIHNSPQGTASIGDTLRAMIMTATHDLPDAHITAMANVTGVPRPTVEAFESLFYNALDRMEDGMYIANDVYPGSRMVEFSDTYFQNAAVGDLLKRAGYNHKDFDLTAYLAGIGDRTFMSKLSAAEDRETELAKHIMGNGLILSRANLLNQKSIGMSRASALMVASRQSGAAIEEPAMDNIYHEFSSQLAEAVGISRECTVELMRNDAGTYIVADAK